jgi:hypothetical protein
MPAPAGHVVDLLAVLVDVALDGAAIGRSADVIVPDDALIPPPIPGLDETALPPRGDA